MHRIVNMKRMKLNFSRVVRFKIFLNWFGGVRFGGKALISYTPHAITGSLGDTFYRLIHRFCLGQETNNRGDLLRLCFLIQNLHQILFEEKIDGELAELGVYKGNTAAVLCDFAKRADRNCYLFDTFTSFAEADLRGADSSRNVNAFLDTDLDTVTRVIGEECLKSTQFVIGHFPNSTNQIDVANKKFAAVSVDCDLYLAVKNGLEWFFPRMSLGGLMLIHDYANDYFPGTKKAVDEFCKAYGQQVVIMPDKSGSAVIRIIR